MSSLHWHQEKDETFIIIKGEVQLEVGGPCQLGLSKLFPKKKTIRLKVGDSYRLTPGTPHRFMSITNKSIILEVSTHHEDDDSVKIKVARELEGSELKGYTIKERNK